jgi:hypothetical protein
MNGAAMDAGLRERRLRALGVEPLRLRVACDDTIAQPDAVTVAAPHAATPAGESMTDVPSPGIRRLALLADPAERRDPEIDRMYTALTEAVSRAGLQPVRVCDVADDPIAAVLVFGAAPPPADVPAGRILRADPLAALHADRERKRLLWNRLLALGRTGAA